MKLAMAARWQILVAPWFLAAAVALAEPGAAPEAADGKVIAEPVAKPEAEPANVGPEGAPWADGRARFDGGPVTPPVLLRDVRPQFPRIARHWRLKGPIVIEAVIDRDGNVRDVRAARDADHPAVIAAIKAISQRKYKPGSQDGAPIVVPVVVTINPPFR